MPPANVTHEELLVEFGHLIAFREMMDIQFRRRPTMEERQLRILHDLAMLHTITSTRYLGTRSAIPRSGSLHTLWAYANNPDYHHLFNKLVRVRPPTFLFILEQIKDYPIFYNNSHCPQAPVELQLAIALHRLGRFGNAESMDDVAFLAGVGHGTVPLYTKRVITAILEVHGRFIKPLDDDERACERMWVEEFTGCPDFAPGIFQYDGTLVDLWQKPGFNGNAYFHRKQSYGLNVQVNAIPIDSHEANFLLEIGCLGSNLQITDYSLGFTGAAHNSLAFKHTAAYKHPDVIFRNDEFAWADSAYTPSYRIIPVHRAPHNLDPRVQAFDKAVSRLRVQSEHCNRSIKARFQCLRGMRVSINSRADHLAAMRQISACLVLRNMCIVAGGDYWEPDEEPEHCEWDADQLADEAERLAGVERRSQLVDAYHEYRQQRHQENVDLQLEVDWIIMAK